MMDRAIKRAKRGLAIKRAEQEMAQARITDIEGWIKIVTTRGQAIAFLRSKLSDDPEVAEFLRECD
jgi:hypothetical protein